MAHPPAGLAHSPSSEHSLPPRLPLLPASDSATASAPAWQAAVVLPQALHLVLTSAATMPALEMLNSCGVCSAAQDRQTWQVLQGVYLHTPRVTHSVTPPQHVHHCLLRSVLSHR